MPPKRPARAVTAASCTRVSMVERTGPAGARLGCGPPRDCRRAAAAGKALDLELQRALEAARADRRVRREAARVEPALVARRPRSAVHPAGDRRAHAVGRRVRARLVPPPAPCRPRDRIVARRGGSVLPRQCAALGQPRETSARASMDALVGRRGSPPGPGPSRRSAWTPPPARAPRRRSGRRARRPGSSRWWRWRRRSRRRAGSRHSDTAPVRTRGRAGAYIARVVAALPGAR